MRKIVILLGIILFMIACEKGNEEVREAKVVVVVYDENGKIATGIPLKMYNCLLYTSPSPRDCS